MLTLLTVSLALAFSPTETDPTADAQSKPVQVEQTTDLSKRLSSAELASIRAGSVPSNCEVFWLPDPVTGELQCGAVVCEGSDGFPEIFDCSEFGL